MNIEEYEVGENRIQPNKYLRLLQLSTDNKNHIPMRYQVEGVMCIEIIKS